MVKAYGKLPLHFEANQGQTDERVKFLSRGSGYSLFLTPEGAVLSLRGPSPADDPEREDMPSPSIRMKLLGSNPAPKVGGIAPLPGKSNYFIGNDSAKWRTNIPHYAKVEYKEVYPGIDLVFYGGDQGKLEYDFIVRPGADPQAVRLRFEGAEKLALDGEGNLLLHTPDGQVLQKAPVIYQEIEGGRKAVPGGYVLKEKGEMGFRLAAYDRSRPLVIDPVLAYSTYLGGGGDDFGFAIAADGSGNVYVTGGTTSANFPASNAMDATLGGSSDVFVTKLNASGSALVYSTYLGGGNTDEGRRITVDATGNTYVTGRTASADFPIRNAVQSSYGGGQSDAFVAKLNAAGSALVYSTYLGGGGEDGGYGIAVDSYGNAHVAGATYSADFPTMNPLQSTRKGPGDAFVTKLSSEGAIVYSTYLGGSNFDGADGIALDASGNAYLVGVTLSGDFPTVNALDATYGGSYDIFVAKLNPQGTALVYSTYLGGGGEDGGYGGIAVDAWGHAYVTGYTNSSDFPTVNAWDATFGGSYDVFVAKLNPQGTALVYSTYLGGSGKDIAYGIAVDADGSAYVAGFTESANFPTQSPFQAANAGGSDAFVAKLNAAGSALLYSTYLGGSNGSEEEIARAIAVDASGNAYVAGWTRSTDFPTANPLQAANAGGYDAFVAKIGEARVKRIVVNGDEWTLSDSGFSRAPDARTYALNIANWFTSGRPGNFLAYSRNFCLTGSQLASTMTGAGHTWTVDPSADFTLPNLLQYDAIFVCGAPSPDNQVLIDYVNAGGKVYLGGGTGDFNEAPGEAAAWNTFLNAFGLKFNTTRFDSRFRILVSINSNHPVLRGVRALFFDNSSIVEELDPSSANTEILVSPGGEGLIGVFEGVAVPPNRPPVAQCVGQRVTTNLGMCVAPASIDAGSYDPDEDPITLAQSPTGPYVLGSTPVTLTATDSKGASSSCQAAVQVVDQERPRAQCNAPSSITPPQAPVSFRAGARDNCSVSSIRVTGYDCYFINPAGKRVDKTGSCVVQINGDTITILDSGGVGTRITWNVEAADGSGNTAPAACGVTVENPGQGRARR